MIDFKTAKYPMETVKKTGLASKEAIDELYALVEQGLETPPLKGETRIRRLLGTFFGDYSNWSPNTTMVKRLTALMRVLFKPRDLGVGLVEGPHELTHIRVEKGMLVRFVMGSESHYIDVHKTAEGKLHVTASWGRMLIFPNAANTVEIGREEYKP